MAHLATGTTAPYVLFFAAVMPFVSAIFLGLFENFVYWAHHPSSEGKFATGTVVKKVMRRTSDNGISNTSYEVDYIFTTADSHQIGGENRSIPMSGINSRNMRPASRELTR